MNQQDWQITNATLVGVDAIQPTAGLHIERGRIQAVLGMNDGLPELLNLNLHGLLVFPGLINSHDSLLATYAAFRGEDHPYLNWLAYDNQLKSSAIYKERMLLDVADLYRLGALRNLVSGVTTVVDHIPHFVRQPFLELDLPVRLLADFGISHSICSYSLDWGEGPRQEYERAAAAGLPYITHIAEGFDPESRGSLRRLERDGALGEYSVLVHGLSLSEEDLDLIAKRQASLVWCPVSNEYLYSRTLPIAAALERGINVCLGADAAMFGSPNLLADLQCAAAILGADHRPETLLAMATTNAARALRLKTGALKPGLPADFFVLQGKHPQDPYRSLCAASLKEIYLVVRDGKPLYGAESTEQIFTEMGLLFDRISVDGTKKIVVTGIKKLLENIQATVGRSEDFYFLPRTGP